MSGKDRKSDYDRGSGEWNPYPLSDFTCERVARGWLNYQSGQLGDRHFWELMRQLVDEEPESAWRVMQRMLVLAPTMDMIATVGAGPLEELLTTEAARFVDRAEFLALEDPSFRAALPYVWLPDSNSAEAQRLVAIGCHGAGTGSPRNV